jgi:hypothetical protein
MNNGELIRRAAEEMHKEALDRDLIQTCTAMGMTTNKRHVKRFLQIAEAHMVEEEYRLLQRLKQWWKTLKLCFVQCAARAIRTN